MEILNLYLIYARFDSDGIISEANYEFSEATACPEPLGMNIHYLINDLPQVEIEKFHITLHLHNPRTFECNLIRRSNDFILQGVDTTKVNEAIQRFKDLEQISDLNISKLHRVNELLNEANRTKEVFLSRVSHELRTPLNGIKGFSEILQKSKYRNVDHYVPLINANANLLHTYVEDLLMFSKTRNSEIILNNVAFSPRKVQEEIIELIKLSPLYNNEEVKLKSSLNIDNELFEGDIDRIRQIIINLLTNALKFTSSGKVTFNIKQHQQNDLEIWIKDTGIGISEENISKIFEDYAQLESGNKHRGLGLGLAIVKTLVNTMNGTIEVNSTLGEGTTFVVRLPLTILDKPEIESSPINFEHKSYKLLYIEDSEVNQQVFGGYLVNENFEISYAASGNEGLEAIQNNDYDCYVIDLYLGDMDGKEVIDSIRKKGDLTPILIITAHASEIEKTECYEVGADNFLNKPYSFEQCVEQVINTCQIASKVSDSEFIKQYSDIPELKNKLIKASLNEPYDQLLNIKLEGESKVKIEKAIGEFLHKSKTSLNIINDPTINEITTVLRDLLGNELLGGNLVAYKRHLYCLKTQYERLIKSRTTN